MNEAEVFAALESLGAGEFAHINGALSEHLHGTRTILQSWGASADLQWAGLFHAAY